MVGLRIARDVQEPGAVKTRWLPSRHMIAEVLTKALSPDEVCLRVVRESRYSLVPTEQRQQFEDLIFVRTGRSCNDYEAILPASIIDEIRGFFPLASFEHEAALLVFLVVFG